MFHPLIVTTGLKLHYNTNSLDPSKTNYNGNISGMVWSSHADQKSPDIKARAYTFDYDGLNRLTQTEAHQKKTG